MPEKHAYKKVGCYELFFKEAFQSVHHVIAILCYTMLWNLSDRAIDIEEFQIEVLSETVLLAKYIAVFAEQNQRSFRSSIWVKRGNDWRMLYHQGTYRRE